MRNEDRLVKMAVAILRLKFKEMPKNIYYYMQMAGLLKKG